MAQMFMGATESLLTVAAGVQIDVDASMLIEMALFLALWALLTGLVFRPYLKARDEREGLTRGSREEAETLLQQASTLFEECESKLTVAREKAIRSREVLTREGTDFANSERQTAREKSEKALATKRAKIQEDLATAREAMKPQIEVLSSAIVQKVMVA